MRPEPEVERSSSIRTRQQGDALVVSLGGHVTELAADALSSELDKILEAGHTRIIFDLSDVVFMGSSGLGQIMRAYRAARKKEGYVRIVNPQPLIADVFELTKLERIVHIYPTVESALQEGA